MVTEYPPVRIVSPAGFDPGTAQTAGSVRLAAVAPQLGIESTLWGGLFEVEPEEALGLPPGAHSYAVLPIGYPLGRFGPVARTSLVDVVYRNRWGQQYA
jgi:hypothetical protein